MNPLKTGLKLRCPKCGEGALYDGLLTVREACPICGLDLRAQDAGDGPAFLVITVLGFAVVILAAMVEINFSPPLWLHAVLWIPLILIGAVVKLRYFKSVLISYQYHHKIGFDDEPRA
jgi:uncharacterized protein (DUF983 family)